MSDNFEQQVKHMLDEVQLAPQPEVWQNVRHAIRPGERKRRFIFWWLLPVALTAGVLIYISNTNDTAKQVSGNTIPHSQPVVTNDPAPVDGISRQVELSINNELQKTVIPVKDGYPTQVNSTGTGKQKNKTNDIKYLQPGTRIKKQTSTENKTPLSSSTIVQKQHDQSSIILDPGNNSIKENTSKDELAKTREKTNQLLNKTALTDSNTTPANAPVEKMPKPASKWDFGLTADAGVTTATKGGMLGFGKKSLMDAAFSSPTGPTSGIANIVYQNHTASSNASFGIYLTAHRELSRSVAFQSSFGFRHQSFSITSSTIKDSFVTGSFVSYPVYRTSSKYKLNYLDLYTGLTLKIAQVNELRLSLGAGIDHQFLLAATQDRKNESLLYTPGSSATNDNSLGAYKRWQPLFRLQLVADINAGKKQWLQLSPYLNYGLRKFEKNAVSAKDHLASFGLTATYFFR